MISSASKSILPVRKTRPNTVATTRKIWMMSRNFVMDLKSYLISFPSI